jgi:hypothetical protein
MNENFFSKDSSMKGGTIDSMASSNEEKILTR